LKFVAGFATGKIVQAVQAGVAGLAGEAGVNWWSGMRRLGRNGMDENEGSECDDCKCDFLRRWSDTEAQLVTLNSPPPTVLQFLPRGKPGTLVDMAVLTC
jgi:hypothetical protein